MSTIATLESTAVALLPGTTAEIPLRIRNNGEIVEGYHLEVVGPVHDWASVEPETVSLYPGSTATATVTFAPPRSAAIHPGEVEFGVRVVPVEHPDEAVVPEGAVEVLPFSETTAELVPKTSAGRLGARHQVAVDSRGNQPMTVGLQGSDQAGQLDVRFKSSAVAVPPGEAVFVKVRVRPDRVLWRGEPRTHQFTVSVEPEDGELIPLEGTYLQQPLLPSWLLKALLAALLLLAALAAIWFGVLKGAVESTAKAAVKPEVVAAGRAAEKAATSADDAVAAAEQATAAAGSAQGASTDAGQSANQARELVGAPALPPVTAPLSGRLEVSAAPGTGTHSDSYVVPDGSTLGLTDLVLGNPQGDFGRVSIKMADQVLLDSALENFRDLDYHFVTPIEGTGGQALTMTVQCNVVGEPPGVPTPTECETALYFGGVLSTPAPPPATP